MAKKSKITKTKAKRQVIGLLVLLLCLIAISSVSTLWVVGAFKSDSKASSLASIMDAENLCNRYIRDDYQQSLSTFHVDDFSSRYNEQTGVYMMFYEVQLKRDVKTPSGVDKYFLNCFVTSKGRLAEFDMSKQKTYVPKAIRRTTGNAFGM